MGSKKVKNKKPLKKLRFSVKIRPKEISMGMDQRLYMGPYIRAKNSLVKDSTSIYTCPNTGCRKHRQNLSKENRCCGQCGTELQSLTVDSTKEKVDYWDLSEKIKEALCNFMAESSPEKLTVFWVPNVYRNCPRKKLGLDYHDALEIKNPSPEEEKQWLLKNYENEIKVLETAYGAENLEICWGALGTYS